MSNTANIFTKPLPAEAHGEYFYPLVKIYPTTNDFKNGAQQ